MSTVQEIACRLILEHPSWTNDEIARQVRGELPRCKCSAGSVAWYRSRLKTGKIRGSGRTASKPGRPPAQVPLGADWPVWEQPHADELLAMAKITTPHIRFLEPEILRLVVEDGESRREQWGRRLAALGISPDLYLWQRSSCVFPGVRRYAGSSEIAQHRRRMEADARVAEALTLDDNDFPKHLWSFVFRGRPFQKQGPVGYSLAHLLDHKVYNNRVADEATLATDQVAAYFGLYTAAANTVYIPNGLIRPTDFSFPLRNLLQRRALELYGRFCNLLPPGINLRPDAGPEWALDQFKWKDPVGTRQHLPAFLRYRNEKMERLLSAVETPPVAA
jgi:hypothetical protein